MQGEKCGWEMELEGKGEDQSRKQEGDESDGWMGNRLKAGLRTACGRASMEDDPQTNKGSSLLAE
jgi:hypothetical protein